MCKKCIRFFLPLHLVDVLPNISDSTGGEGDYVLEIHTRLGAMHDQG